MTAAHPALASSLVALACMALMMLRRFQRFATPQPLDARGQRRLARRPLILLVIGALVLLSAHSLAGSGAALLGALVGAGLASWSARHTRFEYGPDGHATRYLPNVWIGGGVFALFVARLLWRPWPLPIGGMPATTGGEQFDPSTFVGRSPFTTGLFLVFVAYQIVYALLVLRASRGGRAV
ncbi:hypothetical protein [Deinococcus hopiensis]|uniref:DUF1453 domain-containing protein n=1 Tax=Deinococcus hopiensis KR-140 TaxID=695939 RepID=A0A1W1V632_9DEIO|nr:hypothetical protein [Deinococcus hopiensis]SMB88783.1 hypothetical protein SAMN00790413_00178 [Deinococcus hopiensis KR-140]